MAVKRHASVPVVQALLNGAQRLNGLNVLNRRIEVEKEDHGRV
jgi:hypothetical protein